MTPESTESVLTPDATEVEPALTLAYEKIYASEREQALATDPFEGYEQLAVGEGVTDEEAFKKLAESLVGPSQPNAILLWNRESGEIYAAYDRFVGFGKRQGYHQYESGFTRYKAAYLDLCYRSPFKEVEKDHNQDWEVGRVEQFDEVSEPVSSEHLDHDPELSAEVEAAIRDTLLDGQTHTVREESDWIIMNGDNANLEFSEFDTEQRWVFLKARRREGVELEDLARRIGLNCRVYRKGASLVAYGSNDFHRVWSDREQLMVPVGISVG